MGVLRLLVTGAAVAAAVHYVTKKRPDGSSIADDVKAKAPEWMNKAEPYINQVKDQFAKATGRANTSTGSVYPEKFENSSPDPTPDYTS